LSEGVLVDTDVLVDHLRGARRFEPAGRVHVSVVTRAELFAGHATDEAHVIRLLGPFVEHAVDARIAERAGRLRRNHGLRLPDALIAATALSFDLALLTRNRRDFEVVSGLRLA
jgi:hypothetical protein